jgi:hypothetical protein
MNHRRKLFSQQHSLQKSRKAETKVARLYLEWCEIDGCYEMEEDGRRHLHGLLYSEGGTEKKKKKKKKTPSYKREDAFENADASTELTFWHRSFTFNSNKSPT